MTEDELNSLIAHAHRRIEQLQRQLAEQQALEQQRLQVALERQQQEDDKIADSRVKREQAKLQGEFELEKVKLVFGISILFIITPFYLDFVNVYLALTTILDYILPFCLDIGLV